MGSYYILSDQTEKQDLINCPGHVAWAIFDLVDSIDFEGPDIAIFDWEFHGHDADVPDPVYRAASTIEADMKALIKLFFELPPERKFGTSTVFEWIDWFERVIRHTQAHPASIYRSSFFV